MIEFLLYMGGIILCLVGIIMFVLMYSNRKSKPITKRSIIVGVLLVFFGISALGNAITMMRTQKSQDDFLSESAPQPSNTYQVDNSSPPATVSFFSPPASRPESVGVSNKHIDDVNSYLHVSSVPNDVTGNWRLTTLSTSADLTEYAVSYYREHFKSNNEIHAIINFYNYTTVRVSYFNDIIEFRVSEYVDKEEHDAKLLFSGDEIAYYFVYLDNGDIVEIT